MKYQCTNCLSEVTDIAKFCPKCGFNLGSAHNHGQQEDILDTVYMDMGFPKASNWDRFLGALLDGLISTALMIPSLTVFFMAYTKMKNDYSDELPVGMFVVAAFFYLIPLAYTLFKDGLEGGQSWGKRAVGLMVINLDGNVPCNKGKSFVRNIVSALLSIIPYIGWLVEPIFVLTDQNGRKVGDRAANTQVIAKSFYN